MDEFAQSREDDDLFADEFEPLSEPTTVIEDPVHAVPEEVQPSPNAPDAPVIPSTDNKAIPPIVPAANTRNARGRGRAPHNPPPQPQPQPQKLPKHHPPTTNRPLAVRGDRSATGGPLHKKLTEEELTAKLAQMAILNAQKSERHRLSEADQAAFQHREKELAKERREKRVEEQKNSRVMEMERAKNRERKMRAQGGREWDSEKVESDVVDGKSRGRSSDFVRGGFGGVARGRGAGLGASRFAEIGDETSEESSPASGSRGRGGFEIRGRGRGGRGGRGGKGNQAQTVLAAEDFPSLPAPNPSSKPPLTDEKVKSPTGEGPHAWADEMATPVEEKKMALPKDGEWGSNDTGGGEKAS
ncbi:hypothetical protein G7Y89_g4981 [Cudoniella acicularis]|uniref:Uncharacterized protein n=1 Tax=Cudoniella acicularis TaxID=354080 RepID=A0A8H4RRH0_9HELO|nr:hypothetical protein G7Y89_g4981 [Cudoniella acicularis]